MEDAGPLCGGHGGVDRGDAFGDGIRVDAGCVHSQVMTELGVKDHARAER